MARPELNGAVLPFTQQTRRCPRRSGRATAPLRRDQGRRLQARARVRRKTAPNWPGNHRVREWSPDHPMQDQSCFLRSLRLRTRRLTMPALIVTPKASPLRGFADSYVGCREVDEHGRTCQRGERARWYRRPVVFADIDTHSEAGQIRRTEEKIWTRTARSFRRPQSCPNAYPHRRRTNASRKTRGSSEEGKFGNHAKNGAAMDGESGVRQAVPAAQRGAYKY